MRILTAFVLVSALLTLDIACAGATCNSKKTQCNKTTSTDANQIIYDLTIPWPFRRPHGDADGDGVIDAKDKCPGTPRGAVVDDYGCPLDSDGDGVFDGLDKCPGTPKGASVDERGCPLDSDGDGVFDGLDKCPGTPKGATVDKHGCPLDSDGDGVFDGLDKCPDTPSDVMVDKTGCPMKELETEFLDTGVIRAYNINFETNKADIKPSSFKALDEIGSILLKWPMLEIEISGHTDSRGSETYNQQLSEKRAKAVYDYLVGNFSGIDAARLKTAGYGETKPLASNDTEDGRAKNRRVEFTVLNTDELKREVEKSKRRK